MDVLGLPFVECVMLNRRAIIVSLLKNKNRYNKTTNCILKSQIQADSGFRASPVLRPSLLKHSRRALVGHASETREETYNLHLVAGALKVLEETAPPPAAPLPPPASSLNESSYYLPICGEPKQWNNWITPPWTYPWGQLYTISMINVF